jgi:hypothetical protein
MYSVLAFSIGMAAGMLLWGSQMRKFRRELFSASPLRRLAALGYLRGSEKSEAALLLRDYVRWEQSPVLRRRGEKLLTRLERGLHRAG